MPNPPTFGKKNAFAAQSIAAPVAANFPSASVAQAQKRRWPILTLGLCVLFAYVFRLELQHRTDPVHALAITPRDFVALGGISRYLVIHEHEWWRILTAPFLHANVGHLLGNSVTLLLASAYLERMVGRGWLALLFLVGAFGGSVGSLIYSPETTPSVGASGAIMCLVTALFALSFHVKAGKAANRIRYRALAIVIPAFLPTFADGAAQIDYGAHFGGFAAGMAMGFLLLIIWPEEMQTPPWRGAAACGAALGAALALFSASQVLSHYPLYANRDALLMPSAMLANADDIDQNAGDFASRYPHDPLARLSFALALLNHRDFDGAEEQARAGLSEHEILSTEFAPIVGQRLDFLLMAALWGEGRTGDARAMAGEVCAESSDPFLHEGREYLVKIGACK